ncbi:MAG: hypothetical protein J7L22_01660 [Candidatus Marinimicrobia bacterium]|nr:hypothetical protein [Candidatus Neomarinimicrobiota bacterium]
MKNISAVFFLLLPIQFLAACTILAVTGANGTIAASNKDWNNTATRLKIYGSSDGKYGRVYFGYQIPEGFQNAEGVNDQGLWYSGASLPERNDIYNHYQKPTVPGELCEKALAECASVDEVIELYKTYFTPHWQGHSMWVDRNGHSVIIEYGERDVVFVFPDQCYQVMTNFYLSDSLNRRWYNCYRYNAADEMLKTIDVPNHISIQNILDTVHQEGLFPTVSSNIYNLSTGELNIYYFHNYSEYITLNIYELIAAGDRIINLPEQFNNIEILSPRDGQDVTKSSICLEWKGNAKTYDVYCSKSEMFINCEPIHYTAPALASVRIDLSLMFFIFVSLGWKLKRNMSIKAIFVFVIVFFIVSCDFGIVDSPIEDSKIYHNLIIDNLEAGSLYFWQITAPMADGIVNSSVIHYFFSN